MECKPHPLTHTFVHTHINKDFIIKILADGSFSVCLTVICTHVLRLILTGNSNMYLVSCSLGVSLTMYQGKAQTRLVAMLACREVNRLRVAGR